MNLIKNIIDYDFYVKEVSLRIGNSDFTSTRYSKIITKLVFVLVCIYFINNMIDIFQRKKLISNSTTRKTYPKANISLNSNNFKFAFALFDSDGQIITQSEQERYYVPHFYHFSSVNQGGFPTSIIRENYNIRNCTLNDFLTVDENYRELNNLTLYACPDYFDASINGDYDEKNKNLLVFRLDVCDSRSYNNCKPIEEIGSRLKGGSLNMYMSDNDVDVNNFENPFLSYLKLISLDNIDISSLYRQEIQLKQVNIETDQSFFVKDYQSKSDFQITEISNSYSNNAILTSSSIQVPSFYLNNIDVYGKADTITRSYDKILDGISSLGGIMKILIGIGYFLTRKYNENEESINLIKSNHLINFDRNDEKKNDEEKNKALKKKLSRLISEISLSSPNKPYNCSLIASINYKKNVDSLQSDKKETDLNNKKDLEKIEIELGKAKESTKNFDSLIDNCEKGSKVLNFPKKDFEDEQKLENIQSDWNIINIEKKDESILNLFENKFKQKFEELKKYYDEFRFNFIEKLKMSLGFVKNKEKNIKNNNFIEGKQRLENYLDIEYIIERLKEVEKLKKVIFNKHQLQIFNLMNKFHHAENLNNNTKKFTYLQEKLELMDLLSYLQNKYKGSDIATIDHKLGKLMIKLIYKEIE